MQKAAAYTTKNWIYFLLVVLSFVLYGNSIQNDYGLDDVFVMSGNPYVQKGFAGINDILQRPYAKIGDATLDYRPIVLVTYAIEYQFFQANPHVSHFINILLYALSLIILLKILTNVFHLGGDYPLLPVIITLFFAIHPLHTEVVDSLKNRDELLVFIFGELFLLYGFYFCMKEHHRWKYALLSLFFLLLTLMSKITGMVFVFIFIPVFFYNNAFKKNKLNVIFLGICLAMIYRGSERAFQGLNRTSTIFENPLTENKDILIALGTSCKVLLYHIKMLIYPFPLRFYYGYNVFPVSSITNPVSFFSLLLHLLLLIYGIVRFFKKDKLGLFIVCYFIAIAMYSNFPVPYTGIFSERALLLSSLWFIVISALLIIKLWQTYAAERLSSVYRNIFVTLLAVVFILYSFETINRNFLWKNNLTLMSHDIDYLNNSVLANYIYANNLKQASKEAKNTADSKYFADKAVYYFRQTIRLAPNYPEFYFKLGSTYRYNLNNMDSAIANFGYAISIDSLYGDANYELSKLFFDRQDFKKSNYFFAKTYSIQPKDSLTLFYYAQSASNIGDFATSNKINREFIQLYPTLPYSYVNMGVDYSKILKDDSAVICFEKAIDLGYREPQLINKVAYYFEQKGDKEKAAHYKSLVH